ncbi:MAG: hypothetical protein WC773_01730 [Patescibacteria group bacterium]
MSSLKTQKTNLHSYLRLSPWALFVLIVLLIMGLIFFTIWIIVPFRDSLSKKAWNSTSFSAKWFQVILPKPSNNSQEYFVYITDSQINYIITQLNIPNTKNLSSKTTATQIETTGTYTTPTDLPLIFYWIPKVDSNGKLTVSVNDLTVAGVRLLPLATTEVRAGLADSLSNLINSRIIGKITNLKLEQGQITATVVN